MVMGLFGGRREREHREPAPPVDLTMLPVSGDSAPAEIYVRVATLTSLGQMPELKREIYKGNILLLDVSKIKRDKLTINRAVKDLKEVANDLKGDIAGIGDQWVIVTPTAIKVDRTKLSGEGGF